MVWPAATLGNVAGVLAVAVQPVGTVRWKAALRSFSPPLGFAEVVVTVKLPPGTATAGALIANGSCTAIGVEPVTPSTLTRIVAVPTACVVTTPVRLTEATAGSLLL